MIYLWRGGHHPELLPLLQSCWQHQHLLILCPDHLHDFSFLNAWPEAQVNFYGVWEPSVVQKIRGQKRQPHPETFSSVPQIGIFTSGTSSGEPRLVLYSRQNILASLSAIRQLFQTQKIRKIFCYPRPTHTFGLTLGYLHSLLFQYELVVPFGPYGESSHLKWLDAVDSHTLTLGVPTHFYDLIQLVHKKNILPNRSYSCIVGGASVSVSLWEQLQQVLKITSPSIGYGATECSPGICHLPAGQRPSENGEIGQLLSGVQLQSLHEGIQVTGPNVALAVYEKNQWSHLNQTVKLADALEQRHADGTWLYRGRTTLMLNRGGLKYSLEKIEQALQNVIRQPFICLAIKHERLGEDLGILTETPLEGKTQAKAAKVLYDHYHFRLNEKLCRKIPTWPLNASGKIDRRACSEFLVHC